MITKMKNKISSLEIKHALMYYFRFKRQWICATECLNNDVMAITDKDVIEVEIKINKYDLWQGEAKKDKHKLYSKTEDSPFLKCWKSSVANRFYICIPTDLDKEAKKWVEETNKKYGIIIYNPYISYDNSILIYKTAKKLHDYKDESLKKNIMMRVCSENIGLIGKLIKEGK